MVCRGAMGAGARCCLENEANRGVSAAGEKNVPAALVVIVLCGRDLFFFSSIA